jgi:hypothetical protein
MTIRSQKQYDQHAHDQPTQASEWAAQHPSEGFHTGVVSDTNRVNASLDGLFGGGMGQDTRKLMHAAAAGEAPWSHSYNSTGHVSRGAVPGGGDLRPERLSGAQMDEISPGWTDRAYERAQRSDGGNG